MEDEYLDNKDIESIGYTQGQKDLLEEINLEWEKLGVMNNREFKSFIEQKRKTLRIRN